MNPPSPEPLTLYLILPGAVFILIAWIVALAVRRRRQYSRLRNSEKFRDFVPVRYCSERHYVKAFKFVPSEGAGLVGKVDGGIEFHGFPDKGMPFSFKVSLDSVKEKGTENWFLNGLISWIKLERETGSVYIAPESRLLSGESWEGHRLVQHLGRMAEQGESGKASPATS